MEPTRTEIVQDSLWSYKGRNYVVYGFCQVKDADSGNWHRGVEYIPVGEDPLSDGSNTFVRYEQDFRNKFTPLDCDGAPSAA